MNDLLVQLFGDQRVLPNVAAWLGGTRTLVYLALLRLGDLRGSTFTASVREFEILTGFSNSTIRDALTELDYLGMVSRGPSNGDVRSYRVLNGGPPKGSGPLETR